METKTKVAANSVSPPVSSTSSTNRYSYRTYHSSFRTGALVLRERPQGFDDAKMAQKHQVKCMWGCEKLYPTKATAGDHECPFRRATYKDLVNMNLEAHHPPLPVYLDEMNGLVPSGTTSPLTSSEDGKAIGFESPPPKIEGPSWKSIKKALPHSPPSLDRVVKWLEVENANLKRWPIAFNDMQDLYYKDELRFKRK